MQYKTRKSLLAKLDILKKIYLFLKVIAKTIFFSGIPVLIAAVALIASYPSHDFNINKSKTQNNVAPGTMIMNTITVDDSRLITRLPLFGSLVKYPFLVHLNASSQPTGIEIAIPDEEQKVPYSSNIYIGVPPDAKSGNYKIEIEASGADGINRCCINYLTVSSLPLTAKIIETQTNISTARDWENVSKTLAGENRYAEALQWYSNAIIVFNVTFLI